MIKTKKIRSNKILNQKTNKQDDKKKGGLREGIFALLRLEIERFRFSLIKRKPKQRRAETHQLNYHEIRA